MLKFCIKAGAVLINEDELNMLSKALLTWDRVSVTLQGSTITIQEAENTPPRKKLHWKTREKLARLERQKAAEQTRRRKVKRVKAGAA